MKVDNSGQIRTIALLHKHPKTSLSLWNHRNEEHQTRKQYQFHHPRKDTGLLPQSPRTLLPSLSFSVSLSLSSEPNYSPIIKTTGEPYFDGTPIQIREQVLIFRCFPNLGLRWWFSPSLNPRRRKTDSINGERWTREREKENDVYSKRVMIFFFTTLLNRNPVPASLVSGKIRRKFDFPGKRERKIGVLNLIDWLIINFILFILF